MSLRILVDPTGRSGSPLVSYLYYEIASTLDHLLVIDGKPENNDGERFSFLTC